MSDSPNNGIRIPTAWLKVILVPLVTALLAGGGVAKLITATARRFRRAT